ncbi:hypothetical protein [Mesobacillus zeae]|uniref:hypothetical protein n=1 Tax=Mesobacillus zeae TaxID=1917180 RepID=UPI00300B847B
MLSYEEEIKKEGKIEGKIEAIRVIKLLMEKRPVEEIAQELNISIDEVLEIKENLFNS